MYLTQFVTSLVPTELCLPRGRTVIIKIAGIFVAALGLLSVISVGVELLRVWALDCDLVGRVINHTCLLATLRGTECSCATQDELRSQLTRSPS